jgi:GlpG protein
MRHITTFASAEHARRFQDYLIARGIKCSVEDGQGGFALWVYDEDRVSEARQEVESFLQHPDAPQYLEARQEATAVLKKEASRRKAARGRIIDVQERWRAPVAANCPTTVAILLLCVFTFVEMHLLKDSRGLSQWLFFSTDGTWSAVRAGEWWRLWTPMLMHGGVLHILFNLLWWWDFALPIEARKGSWTFLAMVLTISLVANVLEFSFGGQWFLGMSGVNFGLFGYLWVKGKLDPEDGLGVSAAVAQMQVIWFLVCWFGMVGRIANWCHTGGLIMGVLLALMSILRRRGEKAFR